MRHSTSTFATINVVLAVAWLGFVIVIGREHARRSRESPELLATEPRQGLVDPKAASIA